MTVTGSPAAAAMSALAEKFADVSDMFHDVTADDAVKRRANIPRRNVAPMKSHAAFGNRGCLLIGSVVTDPGRLRPFAEQLEKIPLATPNLQNTTPIK